MTAIVVRPPDGAGPVNQGEARAIRYFSDHLTDRFELRPNLQLAVGKAELVECDLIVLGPDCIWVVEVKDLAPPVVVREHEFLVGGELRSHPVRTTRTKAQKIKNRLAAHPDLTNIWVQPLVVLARDPKSLEIEHAMRGYVAPLARAVEIVLDPTLVGLARDRVTDAQREAVRRMLSLDGRARRPRPKFGPYQTDELLATGGGHSWWSASHEIMGTPVRLEVVDVDPMLDPTVQARVRTEAYRAAKVRAQLGSHPRILAPETAFNADDGSVVVVHPDDRSPSLEDCIGEVRTWPDAKRRKFVAALATTVGFCHDRGVAHRTIGPGNVFVALNGFPKLGGFSRAAILRPGAGTVTPDDWAGIGLDFWAAPEHAAGRAGTSADLYALGCLIQYLWPEGAPADLAAYAVTLTADEPTLRRPTAKELGMVASPNEVPPPVHGAVEFHPGAKVAGRWVVDRRLGGGASGEVWKAHDDDLNIDVALKVYAHPDAGEEVQREFASVSDLVHPGIVRVRDGRHLHGRWVLVSEFLDGPNLRAAMPPAADPLTWDAAATITVKLLEALKAAHPRMPRILALAAEAERTDDEEIELQQLRSKGLTHRDVKPENVVLVDGRGPVLVDFGLAAAGGEGAPGGTPQYRPPGAAFESADPDLDLFAVAVMLHEMLTGRHPYTEADPIAGELRVDDGLDPGIRALLERACSPDAETRFHSAEQFLAALATLGVEQVPMPAVAPDVRALVEAIRLAVAESRWDDADALCPEDWDAVRRQIADRRALATGAAEATPLIEIDGYALTFTGERRFDDAKDTGNMDVGPGTSRVYVVRGPGSVMLEVLDMTADSGTRWVQVGDVFQSPPPFGRLGHGLRMGMSGPDGVLRAQLSQARLKSDGWSNTFKATADELDTGAGVSVERTLQSFGGLTYGTQAEVYGDNGARRNYMCVSFDAGNEHVPAVAHFLTRVMPLARGVANS